MIVEEEATTEWLWGGIDPRAKGTPTGSGTSTNMSGSNPGNGQPWTEYAYSKQNGGATVEVDRPSLTASASVSSPPAVRETSLVAYAASVYPVTISLYGLTPNSDGSYTVPVGQLCVGELNNIPAGCTVTSYSWQVSGKTIQGYYPSAQPTSVPNSGINDASSSAPYWYWYGDSALETVDCTAQVSPPNGEGSPFSVTATIEINVVAPTWAGDYVQGARYLNDNYSGNTGYWLYAGEDGSYSESYGGMTWYIAINADSGIPSGSSGCTAQLVDPESQYETDTGETFYFNLNHGTNGLDSGFPYGSLYAVNGNACEDNDSPGVPCQNGDDVFESVELDDSFTDYVMFEPPVEQPISIGDTSVPNACWVPLGSGSWSVDIGPVNEPHGGWSNWPANTDPGGIISSGSFAANTSTFAAWPYVVTGQGGN